MIHLSSMNLKCTPKGLATVGQLLNKGAYVTVIDNNANATNVVTDQKIPHPMPGAPEGWTALDVVREQGGTSEEFAIDDDGVEFVAIHTLPNLKSLPNELFSEGQEVRWIKADCTDEKEVERAFRTAHRYGKRVLMCPNGFFGVVCTAGKPAGPGPAPNQPPMPVWSVDGMAYQDMMAHNASLPFYVCKWATHFMKDNDIDVNNGERGNLVFVGSIAAATSMQQWTGHVMGKAALHGAILLWARDCAGSILFR